MVRDVVERIMPSPSKDDIRAIKNEALNKAIESGATAESVEIHIEIDPQTSKVTAIATGSTEVKTADLLKECDETEARHLAAEDMRLADGDTAFWQRHPTSMCTAKEQSRVRRALSASWIRRDS